MIEFKYESTGHPDYTKVTGVLDKEYTVGEIIIELLSAYPKSCGVINVGNRTLKYENAKVHAGAMGDIEPMLVKKVMGVECYGNIDFDITAVPERKKEDYNRFADINNALDELRSDMYKLLCDYENRMGFNIHSIKVDKRGSMKMSTDFIGGQFGFDIEV